MEEVLKGLKGKSFNKKKLFDFLADIDLDLLSGKKTDVPLVNKTIESIEKKTDPIKCEACSRTYTIKTSLTRHLKNSKMCVEWISNKAEPVKLERGLHLVIDDILDKSVSESSKLECRWCKSTFTNRGNHHKHYNTATICNQLAYQEFKKIFLSL